MISAYCHSDLLKNIDPVFYASWIAHPEKESPDYLPPEYILRINTPWMVIGSCKDTVYLCDPPYDNVTWSNDCEDHIRAVYHLCDNAALLGINSRLPRWTPINNSPQSASYQLLQRDTLCPPREKCPSCLSCPACPACARNCSAPIAVPLTEGGNDFVGLNFFMTHFWIFVVVGATCCFTVCSAFVIYVISRIIRRNRMSPEYTMTDHEMTAMQSVEE
jgi:hypothetical protein